MRLSREIDKQWCLGLLERRSRHCRIASPRWTRSRRWGHRRYKTAQERFRLARRLAMSGRFAHPSAVPLPTSLLAASNWPGSYSDGPKSPRHKKRVKTTRWFHRSGELTADHASQAEQPGSQHHQRARLRCRRIRPAIDREGEVRARQAAATEEALVPTGTTSAARGCPAPLWREAKVGNNRSPVVTGNDVETVEIQPIDVQGKTVDIADKRLATVSGKRSSRDRIARYTSVVVIEGQGPCSDGSLLGGIEISANPVETFKVPRRRGVRKRKLLISGGKVAVAVYSVVLGGKEIGSSVPR